MATNDETAAPGALLERHPLRSSARAASRLAWGMAALFLTVGGLSAMSSKSALAARVGIAAGAALCALGVFAWARWIRRRTSGVISVHEHGLVIALRGTRLFHPWTTIERASRMSAGRGRGTLDLRFADGRHLQLLEATEGRRLLDAVAAAVARGTGRPPDGMQA